MALIERNSKSSLYKGLSSFWLKYFKDSDQLNSIYAGAESLFGQAYLDLMEIILSKSLTNIPVFKKEEWKLLILQEDLVSFDDAVPSSDSRSIESVNIKVVADSVDPLLDATLVSFVDVVHVREDDKEFFPTEGIYNHALTGKSLNNKSWTVVLPSNTTVKDAFMAAKKRVISNKVITSLSVGVDATFTLTYNAGETDVIVTLTTAEQATLTTPDELATMLETKINIPQVAVSIEAGHLIIESNDKEIRVTSSNQASEDLLFIKEFKFLITAEVPLAVENTLLWEPTYYLQLITSGFKLAGLEYRFPITDKNADILRHSKFIMNTIYDPSLVLEEFRDYRFENGFIYFSSNPFDLTNVAFRIISGSKQLAFWMSDVLYDNTLLYDRYGYRFTEKRPSTEEYKLFLRGIIFYYTNGPDIDSITAALNLVAGIPVALEPEEVVVSVQPTLITTNFHEYQIPPEANAVVSVGDVVTAFQFLTDAFLVEDYITTPNWFDNLSVPNALMPGATLEQRQLKSTVSVPVVGESGFIVGPKNTSKKELVTDLIKPYGVGVVPYALTQDAFFVIEIPDAGIRIPVLIPKEYTSAVTTTSELATVISNATGQVGGILIGGLTLDEDATFKMNGTPIVVPQATYANVAAYVAVISAQVPSGIEARVSPAGDQILFLSPTGDQISITECSPTCQVSLGIRGVKSFQGILVTEDSGVITFKNVSTDSELLFRIVDITNYTMTSWAMKPFRQGSGSIVGVDGQPNLTYTVFENILKYSTFKVSFNLANLTAETDLNELINIVLTGKPKYVTPVISPIIDFDDTLEHNATVVPFADRGTFSPVDNTIAESYDSDSYQAIDVIFNTQEKVRVHYDSDFQKADFYQLKRPGLDFFFNANESNLRLDSKDDITVHRSFHEVTIGVQGNLTTEDEARYSFPGVYNQGIQTQGEPYPLTTVERTSPGGHNIGIYAADLTLVHGTYKSEIDPRATHMFFMDSTRPDSIKELGFGVGDFLELKFWPDAGNNGKFTILNVSYDVMTPNGIADILWIENPNAVVDNIPNGKDEFDGSSYAFHYKAGNVGRKWFITIPDNLPMSEILNELTAAVGDNKALFPFDISLVGPDALWGTTAYTTAYTGQDPQEERAFLGERQQLTAEWYRCFLIGATHYDYFLSADTPVLINPLDRLICSGDDIVREDGIMIGFEDKIIGDTIRIGTNSLYNGGEFSTNEAFKANLGDFVTSPIPGYVEYLP